MNNAKRLPSRKGQNWKKKKEFWRNISLFPYKRFGLPCTSHIEQHKTLHQLFRRTHSVVPKPIGLSFHILQSTARYIEIYIYMLGEVRETGDELVQSVVALRASYLYSFGSSSCSSSFLVLPAALEEALDTLFQLACSWHQALEWLEWFLTVEVPQLPPVRPLLLPPSKALPSPSPNSLVLLASLTYRSTCASSGAGSPTSSSPSSSPWIPRFLLQRSSLQDPAPHSAEPIASSSTTIAHDVSYCSSSSSVIEVEWEEVEAKSAAPLNPRPRAEYLRQCSIGRLIELVERIEKLQVKTTNHTSPAAASSAFLHNTVGNAVANNTSKQDMTTLLERNQRQFAAGRGSSATELEFEESTAVSTAIEQIHSLILWWKRAARGTFLWPLECCCPPSCAVFLRSYLIKFCGPLLGLFPSCSSYEGKGDLSEPYPATQHLSPTGASTHSSRRQSEALEQHMQSVVSSSPLLSDTRMSCFSVPPLDHPVAYALRRHLESVMLWVEEEVCVVDEVVKVIRSPAWKRRQRSRKSSGDTSGGRVTLTSQGKEGGEACVGKTGCCCCGGRNGFPCHGEKVSLSRKSNRRTDSRISWKETNRDSPNQHRHGSRTGASSSRDLSSGRTEGCCCCCCCHGRPVSTEKKEEPGPDLPWGRRVVYFSLLSTSPPPNVASGECLVLSNKSPPSSVSPNTRRESMTRDTNGERPRMDFNERLEPPRGDGGKPPFASSADFFKVPTSRLGRSSVHRGSRASSVYEERHHLPPHRVCGWLGEAHRRFLQLLKEGIHTRDPPHHHRQHHFPPPPSSRPRVWIDDDPEKDMLSYQLDMKKEEDEESVAEEDEESVAEEDEEHGAHREGLPHYYYSPHVRRMTRMVFRAWKAYQVVLFLGVTSSSSSSNASELVLYATRAVQLAHRALHYYYSVMEKSLMKAISREVPLKRFFPPPPPPQEKKENRQTPGYPEGSSDPTASIVCSPLGIKATEPHSRQSSCSVSFSTADSSSSLLSSSRRRRASSTGTVKPSIGGEEEEHQRNAEQRNTPSILKDPNNSAKRTPSHVDLASKEELLSRRQTATPLSASPLLPDAFAAPLPADIAASSSPPQEPPREVVKQKAQGMTSTTDAAPPATGAPTTTTAPPKPRPMLSATEVAPAKNNKSQRRSTHQSASAPPKTNQKNKRKSTAKASPPLSSVSVSPPRKEKEEETKGSAGKEHIASSSAAAPVPATPSRLHEEDELLQVLTHDWAKDGSPLKVEEQVPPPPSPPPPTVVVVPLPLPPPPPCVTHLFYHTRTVSLLVPPETCMESHLLWLLRQLTMMMLWITPYAMEVEGKATMKMAAMAAATAIGTSAFVPLNSRLAKCVKERRRTLLSFHGSSHSGGDEEKERQSDEEEEEGPSSQEPVDAAVPFCFTASPSPPPEEINIGIKRKKGTKLIQTWRESLLPPPMPPLKEVSLLMGAACSPSPPRTTETKKEEGAQECNKRGESGLPAYLDSLHVTRSVQAYVDYYQRGMIRWRRAVDYYHCELGSVPLMEEILQCASAIRSVVHLMQGTAFHTSSFQVNEEEQNEQDSEEEGSEGLSRKPAFTAVHLTDSDSETEHEQDDRKGKEWREEWDDGEEWRYGRGRSGGSGRAAIRRRRGDQKEKDRVAFLGFYDGFDDAWKEMRAIRSLVTEREVTKNTHTTPSPVASVAPPSPTSSYSVLSPFSLPGGQPLYAPSAPAASSSLLGVPSNTKEASQRVETIPAREPPLSVQPPLSASDASRRGSRKKTEEVGGGDRHQKEKEQANLKRVAPFSATASQAPVAKRKEPVGPPPLASSTKDATAKSTLAPPPAMPFSHEKEGGRPAAPPEGVVASAPLTYPATSMAKTSNTPVPSDKPHPKKTSLASLSSTQSVPSTSTTTAALPKKKSTLQTPAVEPISVSSLPPSSVTESKSPPTVLKQYQFPTSPLLASNERGIKEVSEREVPSSVTATRTVTIMSPHPPTREPTDGRAPPLLDVEAPPQTPPTSTTTTIWKRSLTAPPGFYQLHHTERGHRDRAKTGEEGENGSWDVPAVIPSPPSWIPLPPPTSLTPPLLPFSPSPLFYLFSLLRRTEVMEYDRLRQLCQLVYLAGVVYQRTLWHIRTKRASRPPTPSAFASPPLPPTALFSSSFFSSRGTKTKSSTRNAMMDWHWSPFLSPQRDGHSSTGTGTSGWVPSSSASERLEETGEGEEDGWIGYPGCFAMLDAIVQLLHNELESLRVSQSFLLPHALALQALVGLFTWVVAAAPPSIPYARSPLALLFSLTAPFSYNTSSLDRSSSSSDVMVPFTSPSPALILQSLIADVWQQVYQIRANCWSVLQSCNTEEGERIRKKREKMLQQMNRKRMLAMNVQVNTTTGGSVPRMDTKQRYVSALLPFPVTITIPKPPTVPSADPPPNDSLTVHPVGGGATSSAPAGMERNAQKEAQETREVKGRRTTTKAGEESSKLRVGTTTLPPSPSTAVRHPSLSTAPSSKEEDDSGKTDWDVHRKQQWVVKHQWWLEALQQAASFFIQTECPLSVATPVSSCTSAAYAVGTNPLRSKGPPCHVSRTATVDVVPWGEWWLPEPTYFPKPKVFVPPPPPPCPPPRQPTPPPPKKPSPPLPPTKAVHRRSTYSRRGKSSFDYKGEPQRPGSRWIEERGKFVKLVSTEEVVRVPAK